MLGFFMRRRGSVVRLASKRRASVSSEIRVPTSTPRPQVQQFLLLPIGASTQGLTLSAGALCMDATGGARLAPID
jgi:hypothetical protein